ncbi:SusC/RagA family TonB-linked outer membrane protein [Sphingobacterium bambusae]|uniref:SusC/RagA family TonB-linked outer membrane protein n=1 Tax=Sphingobacterium bambusae TaxID=662858 RepID=A0ABW6BL66_9SPHI|nr:SusC/RagA family TonB-linked outer membrane protein [Sphingobacterium bambusae]WPL49465.1 SusC/RagA family TonB-linked outer membrane protein [Sphingobacterium bambusae]
MRISILINLVMLTGLQLYATEIRGQRLDQTNVKVSLSNSDLQSALEQIEHTTAFRFVYRNDDIKKFKGLTLPSATRTVSQTLALLLQDTDIEYTQMGSKVLLRRTDKPSIESEQRFIDVTGSVRDSLGNPLAGASILIMGSNRGVSSDARGRFSFSQVADNANLYFKLIGYEDRVLQVGTSMDVTLKSQSGTLEEVIVSTGYQKISKEQVTGSVVSLGAEELEKRNVVNILDNLEGRVPGLTRYNGATTIRGISTMRANADVLIVVDGYPLEGGIENINPFDVERITVLKDAAATAIYGARATNGVIVVDTKKAKQIGRTQVDLTSNITVSQKPDYGNYHYMSAAEQVQWERSYADFYFNGTGSGSADPIAAFESNVEAGLPITGVQYAYYEFQKGLISSQELEQRLADFSQNNFFDEYKRYALRNEITQQYNVGIRTASDRSNSNLVVNYTGNNAGIINAFDRRLNISFKGGYRIADWIDANYGINAILGNARSHNNQSATTPFNVPAYYSMFGDDGQRVAYALDEFNVYSSYNELFAAQPALYEMGFNHLDELERDFNDRKLRNTRYFVDLDIKPFKGLSIKPQFQYEDNRSESSIYSEEDSYAMRRLINAYTIQNANGTYSNLIPAAGRLRNSFTNGPSYTARLQAAFDRTFGDHTVFAIGGGEFREVGAITRSSLLFGYDDQLQSQANTSLNFVALRAHTTNFWGARIYPNALFGSDISGFTTEDIKNRFASAYGNITYTYKRRYNLFGSIRKDYANVFGLDKAYRGRPLWSVGGSWNVTNEPFMSQVDFLNNLKIRATYGITGNISSTTTSRLTANILGTNPLSAQPIATIVTPPNEKLRWEKTATTNFGVDFSLFQNRLRGTLDYYRKEGTDLFATTRLDATIGFTQMVINNGDMVNDGLEGSLSYDWFRARTGRSFRWSSTVNFGYNKNRITFVDELVTNPAVLAGSNTFTIGNPVNSLYSYQFRGLDETGLPLWLLPDGSLVTTSLNNGDINAVVFSGGANPVTNLALNNEVAYKGWSLNVFMMYYGGHYLRDNPPRIYRELIYGAAPSYLLDSWTPENTDTDIPAFGEYYQAASINNALLFADRWVKKADFFRVRTIALGYTLPKLVSNTLKVDNIKLRFQVDNPNLIWTKVPLDIDSETRGLRTPTNYVFGLNLTF